MQTAQIGDFGRLGDRREWALEIPKIRRDREISHVCVNGSRLIYRNTMEKAFFYTQFPIGVH